jgi:hypothetical protein
MLTGPQAVLDWRVRLCGATPASASGLFATPASASGPLLLQESGDRLTSTRESRALEMTTNLIMIK